MRTKNYIFFLFKPFFSSLFWSIFKKKHKLYNENNKRVIQNGTHIDNSWPVIEKDSNNIREDIKKKT